MGKSAPEFLSKARDLMLERGQEYDKRGGERSMGRAVQAFNIVTGHSLSEAEGWLLLQVLKDVRQWQSPHYHQDSAEDCVAYAALKGEALEKEHHAWQETHRNTGHPDPTGAGLHVP